MTKEEKATIRGVAIGDSYIEKQKNYYRIHIIHSAKQYEYIKFKANYLSKACNKEIKITEFDNNGYPGVRMTVSNGYFKFVYSWLYKPNKKLTLKYLRKVNNFGVAFWYMDDGSLYAKKRNGKIHSYELVISTCCTESEAKDCIFFFKERFDVNFTLKLNKGKYSLRCGTKEAKKFLSFLEPYIPDCMKYKTFRHGTPKS